MRKQRAQRADRCMPEKARTGIALILHRAFHCSFTRKDLLGAEGQWGSTLWWSSGDPAASIVLCIHIETQRREPGRRGRKQRNTARQLNYGEREEYAHGKKRCFLTMEGRRLS
jgi:hypothetical protein